MRSTLATLTLLAAACAPGRAPSTAPTPARPADRVWFTGVSNVRHFTCRAEGVRTELALPPGATVDGVLARDRPPVAATLVVPVAGLDCGIRAQSHHLHKALKAGTAPTIEFRLTDYALGAATPESGTAARVVGALRIAGIERPVTLAGVVRRDATGALRLQGWQAIRPTDYGVTPPRRFLGLLRVRDSVTVHFDVGLSGAPRG
jgi:hypothetical protein